MCVYLILAPIVVQAGLAASPEAAMPCPWDLTALSAPPATYEAPAYGVDETAGLGANPELRFTGEDVQPLFYEGLPWQGRPTRVFAWYGVPKHADGEKVPGMVLVHGGGGTAFDAWVRKWNERGYAAIAMDVTGSRPGGKPGERPRHEWGGPPHAGFEQDIDLPVADQWVHHAIADIVLADSLLRSFPEVDADRIGLTGISWGGFLTCIASAVDTRFRFAVPVYGCGFHNEGPALQSQWQQMGEAGAAKWFALWDPSRYLPYTTMPMLWITGSNDFFAPLSIHAKSMALPQGPCTLCVPVGMSHSHVHGWAPEEIYAYADSMLKGGRPLAKVTGEGRDGRSAWVTFEAATPLTRVDLVATADVSDWTKCSWTVVPAEVDAAGGRAVVVLPDDCRAYFFNLTDDRGLLVSTKNIVLPAEPGAADRIKTFCIDFNWGPEGFAPPGMYANASPEQHVAWYKQLGVNTIQTFCVSCPGYAWYPSEVAPVQPGTGGTFLPEMVKLGHAAGLRVMGYFCIGANAYWSETHPGLSHPFSNAIAIPFTTAYLDYLSRVIAEAVGKTGIDGFMIDWMYNASHHYPEKEYAWLDCEKQMYLELFGEPFPGDAAMDAARVNEFNRRATARCWERIREAAKSVNPGCIIWLSAYDLAHPTIAGSKMLQEVDWLMNEHPDPAKLDAVRGSVGSQTRLIQCICGWGDQHHADVILSDPKYADVGLYGFARPDADTTLPPEDGSGNARNIAAMRQAFAAP